MLQARLAMCVAQRTLEIAVVGNLEDTNAGVLLVVFAQTAVEWTSFYNGRTRLGGDFCRQSIIVPVIPPNIAVDEVFSHSMRGTTLPKIHSTVTFDDLCWNQGQTLRAQALRCSKVAIVYRSFG
jgi:hypothetical protein